MAETYRMMTPQELVDVMLRLEVDECIDIAAHVDDYESEFGEGADMWYGILRINADTFCEKCAWLCDYYGGEAAKVITLSDCDYDYNNCHIREFILNQLEGWLKEWEILQPNGKVAVECIAFNVKKYIKRGRAASNA